MLPGQRYENGKLYYGNYKPAVHVIRAPMFPLQNYLDVNKKRERFKRLGKDDNFKQAEISFFLKNKPRSKEITPSHSDLIEESLKFTEYWKSTECEQSTNSEYWIFLVVLSNLNIYITPSKHETKELAISELNPKHKAYIKQGLPIVVKRISSQGTLSDVHHLMFKLMGKYEIDKVRGFHYGPDDIFDDIDMVKRWIEMQYKETCIRCERVGHILPNCNYDKDETGNGLLAEMFNCSKCGVSTYKDSIVKEHLFCEQALD